MPSNQPVKKVRFEAYLTPENHRFLRTFAASNRRKMSSEMDFIVTVMRKYVESRAQKEKAPDGISV